MIYNVHFLHVARYSWNRYLNHVVFVEFGQAWPGKLNVFQNKLTIFLRKVELFCLFVGCSYASMEATVLSCRFSCVWSGMPKVLWNNKSPISLESAQWFCWFFACGYLNLVGYPLKWRKFENYMRYQIFLLQVVCQVVCTIFYFWLVWLNTGGPLLHCTCFSPLWPLLIESWFGVPE